ncbi:MAG: hypothetical protein WCR21_05585 [Bacteroidota bacterium]
MVKAKSNKKTKVQNDSNDLRQDLKDFKDTKKSIQDLMKVKQDNKSKGDVDAEQVIALKQIEDKAKSALDKLFKGKST